MPTWIVAHSEQLCNFLIPILLNFSSAQQRHVLNVIEALLVGSVKYKTLSALTRLLQVEHADQFALADFFRVSPWSATAVRQALTQAVLKTVVTLQARVGWRLLFLRIDDSLCPKDVATHALEAVSLHYDHVVPRRQTFSYTNASRYVTLGLQLGPIHFTLTWRLYLKRSQVQRLNRSRQQAHQALLIYYPLRVLVEQMLDEVAPQLPSGCTVYVLFDAWYGSHQLFNFIRAHGWQWICAAKSNRRLSDYHLAEWWFHLGHQPLERVTTRSTKGSHTYLTRHVVGRLPRYPDPVIALLSKRHRRDAHAAYFLCSNTHLSVRCIVKYYGYRWQTEVDNWFLKERLGLADYRLHSLDAIQHWHTLVFAAFVFLQAQRVAPLLHRSKAPLASLSEVLAEHQRGHAEQTIQHIAHLVRTGISDDELITMLLPT